MPDKKLCIYVSYLVLMLSFEKIVPEIRKKMIIKNVSVATAYVPTCHYGFIHI